MRPRAFVSESVALRRELGDPAGIATALNALGGVYHFRGNLDRARETFVESLQLKQGLGNENWIAVSLMNLGLVERDAGRIAVRGGARSRRRSTIWERTGDRQRVAVGLHNAALLDLDRGRYDEAAAMLEPRLRHRPRARRPDRDGVRARRHGRGSRWSAATSTRPRPPSPWRLPRAVAAGVRIIVPLLLEAAGSPRGGAAATTSSRSGCGRRGDRRATASGLRRTCPPTSGTSTSTSPQVRERLDPAAFADAWAEGADLPSARGGRRRSRAWSLASGAGIAGGV